MCSLQLPCVTINSPCFITGINLTETSVIPDPASPFCFALMLCCHFNHSPSTHLVHVISSTEQYIHSYYYTDRETHSKSSEQLSSVSRNPVCSRLLPVLHLDCLFPCFTPFGLMAVHVLPDSSDQSDNKLCSRHLPAVPLSVPSPHLIPPDHTHLSVTHCLINWTLVELLHTVCLCLCTFLNHDT